MFQKGLKMLQLQCNLFSPLMKIYFIWSKVYGQKNSELFLKPTLILWQEIKPKHKTV